MREKRMFGVVSEDEFEAQLASLSPSNLNSDSDSIPAKIVDIKRGRGHAPAVPEIIREIVAEEALNKIPAKSLAEHFGISESSVSAYKNGATSTASYNEPNEKLKESTDKVRDNIIHSARGKLLLALESITDDKLSEVKARDAAGIAKDMSAVIKNLEPADTSRAGALNQQFIFYAPKTKQESDFEVIDAPL